MPRITTAALSDEQSRRIRAEARRFVDSLGLDPATRGAALRVYYNARAHEFARGLFPGDASAEVLAKIRAKLDRAKQNGSTRADVLTDEFKKRAGVLAKAQRADTRANKAQMAPKTQANPSGASYSAPCFLDLKP